MSSRPRALVMKLQGPEELAEGAGASARLRKARASTSPRCDWLSPNPWQRESELTAAGSLCKVLSLLEARLLLVKKEIELHPLGEAAMSSRDDLRGHSHDPATHPHDAHPHDPEHSPLKHHRKGHRKSVVHANLAESLKVRQVRNCSAN